MFINHSESWIKNEMESSIGRISRLDFTSPNKKPGFNESYTGNIMSVFAHFHFLYDNAQTKEILDAFQKGIAYYYYPSYTGEEYWIMLKAKNPIQETWMNSAQIVENCRFLENKLEEQEETIKKLEEKLNGVHNVVYQLVGGLFNQSTQSGILEEHLRFLFPENNSPEKEDSSKWQIWPTTRQGDECERRIDEVEEKIKYMLSFDPESIYNFIADNDDEDQDLTIQCLKQENDENEDGSVSTHSSMPSLISYSSSSTEERIKNSYELCGNN